jgi:hypothetical protein
MGKQEKKMGGTNFGNNFFRHFVEEKPNNFFARFACKKLSFGSIPAVNTRSISRFLNETRRNNYV